MKQNKDEYISKMKQLALANAGIDIDEVERYEKYITSEDADDITTEAEDIAKDLQASKHKTYVDAHIDKGTSEAWKVF